MLYQATGYIQDLRYAHLAKEKVVLTALVDVQESAVIAIITTQQANLALPKIYFP